MHFKSEDNKVNQLKNRRPLLKPIFTVKHISEIDLSVLAKQGKRLVLIDVDNTIVGWHGTVVSTEIIKWIEQGKNIGFNFCLISNTHKVKRLQQISHQASIPYVRGMIKPSRSMFRKALALFNEKPEKAIMIGDQLFTDILGANRSQIDSAWVEPLTKTDFWSTKISRMMERVIIYFFNKKK